MSNLTRALLILALAAGLVFAGWWARGQRLGAEATRALAEAAASADTLARMRGERQVAQRRADSLAREAARRDSAAAVLRGEVAVLGRRVTATRDSLRLVGATSVPIALLDSALALADARGAEAEAERSVSAILREQVIAGARLTALADSTSGVWQRRAERAEASLGGVSAPRASRGWPLGAYVAVGGVTAAACSEGPLSLGCLSGVVALASRL